MRIVIVGGSKFGTATAQTLIEQDHEVVVIDRDRGKLERLAETLDCGMIEGDGTSPSILREAHASEDDVLIALTNASDDNILAALVGRSVGYGRVIPQIISPELLDVCAELDLADTITPHVTVAESICRALEEKSEMSEVMNLSNALRLKRLTVPEGVQDEALANLELPDHISLIARVRGDEEVLITTETHVQSGDEILLAVKKDDIEAVKDAVASWNS
ncbi:potassium channel family protein [Primorskyibacter sp. S187A]|uniref:potassium channel family protein n=1 Tax=Primorskyibacter sp. S187A TaxID=3415130 RepID=UPI003C7C14B5